MPDEEDNMLDAANVSRDPDFDPRSREDLKVMWDRAIELEELVGKIRKRLDKLGLFSKPEAHQEATRDIHEILEEGGF